MTLSNTNIQQNDRILMCAKFSFDSVCLYIISFRYRCRLSDVLDEPLRYGRRLYTHLENPNAPSWQTTKYGLPTYEVYRRIISFHGHTQFRVSDSIAMCIIVAFPLTDAHCFIHVPDSSVVRPTGDPR